MSVGSSEAGEKCGLIRARHDSRSPHRELLDLLATLKIDIRPGRRFERDTQKRRQESRKRKLEALEAKKHAA
jgi:hypothetical protein